MPTLIVPAPAKLNLFLHVLGRRADGYHDLQTVFQFLDYGDELSFISNADKKIHLRGQIAELPLQQDLIFKAASLLQQVSGCTQGVNIQINKRLPLGAGLGGGSSNAATTLLALNKLWQLDFSLLKLAELGLQLGADVPIFIHGQAAWAEGIGEKLQTLENLFEPWYLVLIPPCQVTTAKIFSDPQLTHATPPIKIEDFLQDDGQGNFRNDLETIVCKRYPEVAKAKQWLSQFATARMTGTGSCIFATFDNQQQAATIAAQIPEWLTGFIAKGLNRSPAHIAISIK